MRNCIGLCAVLVVGGIAPTDARELTLPQALEMAVQQSTRGRMIRGNLEIAEQAYFARRINFYVPEISINGSLPSYSRSNRYEFFGADKFLVKRRMMGLQSNLQFKQSLITGGNVEFTADLTSSQEKYPRDTLGTEIQDHSRLGNFSLRFEQPILKPSTSKNELNDRRDDFRIAEVTRVESETQLRRDVITAYLEMLKQEVTGELVADKLEAAGLKATIDSAKMADSILSEEEWLVSKSARLDAELDESTSDNNTQLRKRELTGLLDMDVSEPIVLSEPSLPAPLSDDDRKRIAGTWENSVTVLKADIQYRKADRAASFAAGSHGITGSLAADYAFGRGKVRKGDFPDESVNTNNYGLSLNFSVPLWDGGASGAAVKAARFSADQARLDYERVQKGARAEIVQLLNQLDVGYRRLQIIKQQIDVNQNKVRIADERFKDGQISRETYLASEVALNEARLKYLTELATFLTNKNDLNGKLPGTWD